MRSQLQSARRPEPWRVHFFQRHAKDDADQSVPGRTFLDEVPVPVAATIIAVVAAVAEAPPPQFSGGGKWEAMHGSMKGYYEIRVDGYRQGGRCHFRLFCLLERNGDDVGLGGPSIVILTGMQKKFGTTFSETDYRRVRRLGDEYLKRNPRSIAID